MTRAETVLNKLNELSIPFELARHDKLYSIEECARAEELLGAKMPKNLLLTTTNRSAYALLVMNGSSSFKTGVVSKNAGYSRLSFASKEDIRQLLGTYPGAVSPFGLLFDTEMRVECLIDRALIQEEYLLFHPLDNTCSVKIRTKDLTDVFLPATGHKARIIDTLTIQ
jgi:Ala-tRNA(Pro) deacylase